jgi:MFS family permease
VAVIDRSEETAAAGETAAPGRTREPARRVAITPWLVWGVGVLAYVLTVMQRTTLGVAGLHAAQRFQISPGALSAFVFVQVAIYVAAQIPAGLMVDRWGSRTMLVVSGGLLAVGQFALSATTSLGPAILARVLVGTGDAIAFVGVLALIPQWFPARRVPVLTQLTTILGQLGQVLSAVPFLALLHAAGWFPAFAAAASASALGAVLVVVLVKNAPDGGWSPAPSLSLPEIGGQLRRVWARPGTKLGFFGHMGTQFSMMVFALLWGVPYLVSGQGLSTSTASALVSLFVVCTICIGPVVGVLTMQHPLRRSWLVLTVIGANVLVWTAILAIPGPAPMWLLVLLVMVLSAGGPGSVVGIDIARTSNRRANLGVAQSIVNLGGFLATLTVLATMGLVMTALGGFTGEAFRVAWLVQYPVWAAAVVGIVITRRQARRLDAERGVVPRPILSVLAARRHG